MKSASLLLLLVAVNIATADMITIPIRKNVPESTNESNGFLDNETAAVDKLINYSQYMYAGEIQVGNSKHTFSVDFDTGSNLLWLTSKACSTCVKDGFKNNYDCTTADGCQLTSTPGQITYLDGSGVYGKIANAPVSIAGLAPVTEAFLLVDKSVKNKGLNSDGLMGLGVYDEHNVNSVSFVNQLYKQGIITTNQFSFYLGFGQSESELVIGGYDSTKIASNSPIYYHPIVKNGQQNDSQRWTVAISSISFGTQTVALNQGKNYGIVDSGSSLILLRNDVYKSFISYLKANYPIKTTLSGLTVFYSVACGTTLPDLTFTLADVNGVNRNYSVPSSFYLLKENNVCLIGIQGGDAGDIQFILGDVFMRRFVSIFDYNSITMGLATSTANPSTATQKSNIVNNTLPLLAIAFVAIAGLIFVTIRGLRK